MKRWVTLGMYSLFAQAKRVDWDKLFDLLKGSGVFTGVSLHLLSPWGQHPTDPFYPWPYGGTKFNMLKRNQEWLDMLKDVLSTGLKEGIDFELCFNDRYFINKWIKYLPFKAHPFRDNNIGVD